MSVPNPKIPAPGAAHTNPRRTAPEFSVSLRHAINPTSRSSGKDSDVEPSKGGMSGASRMAAHSGHPTPPLSRAMETRNAEKWFDDSNNNGGGNTNVRIIDDDPPFYLPKHRSLEQDIFPEQRSNSQPGSRPAAVGFGPAPLESAGGTVDEYRSVIDDLTVENRELKRRLRKYEGLHSGHLQDDKLFEVRVYNLSQPRRRRLESMLCDFVNDVARSLPGSNSSGAVPPFASLPYQYAPAATATKRSGSSASNQPVDSAYASMSQSASVSQAHPNHSESRRSIRPSPETSLAPAEKPRHQHPQDQRVQSYLQNMSRRLLPKYQPVMTEKTKKRVIVKRLEQLFVGRSDSSSKLSQSHQQQEVSQSAANADRRETEAMGHHVQAEGRREAKMLRQGQATMAQQNTDACNNRAETSSNGNGSSTATPDQRPTRPFDLDPSRAQNPTETISYMKHLGFKSPTMNSAQPQGDQEGWIFLNLLINMAQLHTLNVTPGFVRKAVQDVSSNFELSEDGQNIRWRGGPRMSKLSSDSSINSDESTESVRDENAHARGKQSSKLKKTAAEGDVPRTREKQQRSFRQLRHWLAPQARPGNTHYSPLFYNPAEWTSISPPQGGVSSNSIPQGEDRSGGVSGYSASQENVKISSRTATDGETGNLIFYQRARFYTDLKGDPTFAPTNTVYEKLTEDILGAPVVSSESTRNSELKGALSSSEPVDVTMTESGMDYVSELRGFDNPFTFASEPPKPPHPVPLPMSGVGDVTPSDNFCVAVLLDHRKDGIETVRTMLKDLEPAPLPPPLYAFLPYSSSSSDLEESEDEDDVKYQNSIEDFAAELNVTQFVPPTLLGEFSSRSSGNRESAHPCRGTGTSDESSLDMLEFARKADPDRVARYEREYDAIKPRSAGMDKDGNDDERVDNPVPPSGSVAATIGDRSTAPTNPEDNASVDERHRRFLRERKSSLKREHSDGGESPRVNKQTRVTSKHSC